MSDCVGEMHSFLVVPCALVLLSASSQALAPSHAPRHLHAGRHAKASAKVGFGKHSDDSYQDVWEQDQDYVQWVERTRSRQPALLKFQTWIKRKAAELDEDESMGGGQAILFDSEVEAANVVASSSDSDRNYGSLRNFWLARTGCRWPKTCSYSGCKNPPTLGGHVWVKCQEEPQIVPICGSCNSRCEVCIQVARYAEPLTPVPRHSRSGATWTGPASTRPSSSQAQPPRPVPLPRIWHALPVAPEPVSLAYSELRRRQPRPPCAFVKTPTRRYVYTETFRSVPYKCLEGVSMHAGGNAETCHFGTVRVHFGNAVLWVQTTNHPVCLFIFAHDFF